MYTPSKSSEILRKTLPFIGCGIMIQINYIQILRAMRYQQEKKNGFDHKQIIIKNGEERKE